MANKNDMDKIYEEYIDKVKGYLYSHMENKADVDDFASEVFLKITQNIEKFDETKASLSTWIYTITRNTLYDHFRVNRVFEEIPETQTASDNIEEEYLNEETMSELAEVLKKLSPKERDLIILIYYDDLSIKEAAEKIGMSYSNAKLVHKKSLAKLKGFLDSLN
ncbi:MAG: sigma-70 family RNA polymerase sigma factor [Butyrivibrio sp.]|nr:sigma-70 family RNA polymerase sigma factor [Butyrivibrio sp.]